MRAQEVAKHEQFQQPNASSSSSFLDREQFRQPDAVSIDERAEIPAASSITSSSDNPTMSRSTYKQKFQ